MWAIEFRNGSFFQNLESDFGGPRSSAARFDSKKETEAFMKQHEWLYHNGGMALEIDEKKSSK